MKPLFEVGEEVLLVSKSCPELNGEYTISAVAHHGKCVQYGTGGISRETTYNFFGEDKSICYAESALRKKHKPSEYDFNQLIEEINGLVTV